MDPHSDLGRFFDGELPASEVDAFRTHLATCDRCQRELEELLQLDALGTRHLKLKALQGGAAAAPPAAGAQVIRLPVRAARWTMGGLALAASLVLVVMSQLKPSVPDSVWEPGGSEVRLAEARSSYPRAARYRKFEGHLGAGSNLQAIPHEELGALQKRGEHLAVAAALLSRNQPGLVDDALKELSEPSTPEAWSERAMAFLVRHDASRGDFEEALRCADRALAVNPKHGPALWNKGLALEKLGLTMLSARMFGEVERLAEPGWASEARFKAEHLRNEASHVRKDWNDAWQAGQSLAKSGASLPPKALGAPIVRVYFYDAVRTRTSAQDVLALLPVAEQLDQVSGGSYLRDYVLRTSKRDFTRRAKLSQKYGELLEGKLPVETQRAVARELWTSGEPDLAIGALIQGPDRPAAADLEKLESSAQALQDPWFTALVWQQRAKVLESGDPNGARRALENAIQIADGARLHYRSLMAMMELTTLLLHDSELEAARAVAGKAADLAVRQRDWGMQWQIIEQLAQLARVRNDLAVGKAYLEDAVERTKEDHDLVQERFLRQQLAALEIESLNVGAAREQIDAAIATGVPLTTVGVGVLSDVARMRPSPADRQAIDVWRTKLPGMPLSERALATHFIGRWSIEVDPEEGRRLLRDAIAQAGTVADQGGDGGRARAFSFSSLIMDAAKRKDFAAVLSLFAEEAGAPFPGTCAVALSVDMERSVVVVRGPRGELDGEYRSDRTVVVPERLDGLVPARMVSALDGCRTVQVMARPPIFGKLGALPSNIPWSYALLGRSAPNAPPEAGTHLVVQSVAMSDQRQATLQIPRPWMSNPPPQGISVLEGVAATPSRILAEMKGAADVDIVTHSLVNPVSGEAYLVTAPDGANGDELRATQIRDNALLKHPIVTLSACHAAHSAPVQYEPRSLPAALLIAGAKVVLAADEEVPESEGPDFFDEVRTRIRRDGVTPAVALRDARQAWLSQGKGKSWIESVLLFE